MATAPRRVCSAAGCHAVSSEARCPAHPHPPRQRTGGDREYDRERGTSTSRGYGGAWPRIRRAHLVGEPLCRVCLSRKRVEPAVDVDHIKPLRSGGTHASSNLQGLCRSCHVAKTADDRRRAASAG